MKLVVVGGGYSGVSLAVQAARRAPRALEIAVVEPAAALGRGLAYSTSDPDHRINGPMAGHSVDLNDLDHPHAWVQRVGLHAQDPQLESCEGLFPRRADFARYLADSFAEHAASNPSGSRLRHVRARAVDVDVPDDESGAGSARQRAAGAPGHVLLDDGTRLAADAVVLATGNPPPRVPPVLARLAAHPRMVADPWQAERLAALPREARLVLMGTGLTAADMLATLVRQGHRGPITVFSRRGLRPRIQRPVEALAEPLPGSWLIDRINGAVPAFLPCHGDEVPTVRGLTRALRARIAHVQGEGRSWHVAFDELRDVVWQVWPRLPVREKRRFLQRMRPWYDVHRFRMAPQTLALIEPAVAGGQILFRAAELEAVDAGTEPGSPLHVRLRGRQGTVDDIMADAFINCTGLDSGFEPPPDSLLGRLQARGALMTDPSGLGYAVDAHNCLLGTDGRPQRFVRLIGPPTAGHFGDPLGVLFIATQIHRLLPDLLGR